MPFQQINLQVTLTQINNIKFQRFTTCISFLHVIQNASRTIQSHIFQKINFVNVKTFSINNDIKNTGCFQLYCYEDLISEYLRPIWSSN